MPRPWLEWSDVIGQYEPNNNMRVDCIDVIIIINITFWSFGAIFGIILASLCCLVLVLSLFGLLYSKHNKKRCRTQNPTPLDNQYSYSSHEQGPAAQGLQATAACSLPAYNYDSPPAYDVIQKGQANPDCHASLEFAPPLGEDQAEGQQIEDNKSGGPL